MSDAAHVRLAVLHATAPPSIVPPGVIVGTHSAAHSLIACLATSTAVLPPGQVALALSLPGAAGDADCFAIVRIDGMTCQSCVRAVKSQTLALWPSLVALEVALEPKLGVFAWSSSQVADPAALVARIEDLGFDAVLLSLVALPSVALAAPSAPPPAATSSPLFETVPEALLLVGEPPAERAAELAARIGGLDSVLAASAFDKSPTLRVLVRPAALAAVQPFFTAPAAPALAVHCAIDGMTCGSCTAAIQRAVSAMPAVLVAISLQTRRAWVAMAPTLAPAAATAALAEAVSDCGFDIVPLTAAAAAAASPPAPSTAPLSHAGSPPSPPAACAPPPPGSAHASFVVHGMTCASCVRTIETHFRALPGVSLITVALLAETADVTYDPARISSARLAVEFTTAGFSGSVLSAAAAPGAADLMIGGMTCGSCVRAIETAVRALPGIRTVAVNLMTEGAHFEFDAEAVGLRDIVRAIETLGFTATAPEGSDAVARLLKSEDISRLKRLVAIGVSCSAIAMTLMLLEEKGSIRTAMRGRTRIGFRTDDIIQFLLSLPIQLAICPRIYRNAIAAIRHPTMDVLVGTSTAIVWLYSAFVMIYSAAVPAYNGMTFFDSSSMLVTFVMTGRLLEAMAKARTSTAITSLLRAQPADALLMPATPGASPERIPIALVQRDDVLLVRPGARVPTDGVVVSGQARVNEAMLTGEARPVRKLPGDSVYGGSVCVEGAMELRATRVGRATALGQMIALVESAQTSKAPIQGFADHIAGSFVPIILLLSLCTFLGWWGLTTVGFVGEACIPHGWTRFTFSLMFGLSVLVIACPCALGLATPTAVMVGTGVGASLGVLFKGGAALEACANVTHVLFDKTGTLTYGSPRVIDTALADLPGEVAAPAGSRLARTVELLRRAAALESLSEHAIGAAIVAHAAALGIAPGGGGNLDIVGFESVVGHGVRGAVNGVAMMVGSRAWMAAEGRAIPDDLAVFEDAHAAAGRSVVFVVSTDLGPAPRLAVAIADAVRPEARAAVRALRRRGIRVQMVTGDARPAALAVAADAGIDAADVHASILPANKLALVRRARASVAGAIIAMVGDGINDAPALVEADVGFAIGAGTDVAVDAADVVLQNSSVLDVVLAIDLAGTILRRIKLNLVWALMYNMIGVPLAAGVFYWCGTAHVKLMIPPWTAAALMAVSSVSVVTSSLMLRKYKVPPGLRPQTPQVRETGARARRVAAGTARAAGEGSELEARLIGGDVEEGADGAEMEQWV